MEPEAQDFNEIAIPYINFSKDIEETDANVRKICSIIRELDKNLINKYYHKFFFVQKQLYQNVFNFFRILTINKIQKSKESENPFNTIADFLNYVANFKDRLIDNRFPENFLGEINDVNGIESIIYEDVEYQFDIDFVRKFVKPDPTKFVRQFQYYGSFNFFRYFMMYYTPQGIKLKNLHSSMWKNIFNLIIEKLSLDSDEYFIDHSRFYMPKGTYESDYTWGCLIKSDIRGLEIEEHRTKSIQLFISITPQGPTIGTYLGTKSNDFLKGFLERNVDVNKKLLIDVFKELKIKYKDKIRIQDDDDRQIELNKSLDIETFRENILDLFRTRYSINYYEFKGDQVLFDNIIEDFFKVYKILIGEGVIGPPVLPSISEKVELNLEQGDLSAVKNKIIKELKEKFIGINIESIVEKILSLLKSEKNIILYGAPGTGKTVILEKVFTIIKNNFEFVDDIVLTTATSDWTIFETIGGLVPREPKLDFKPGLFLRCFRKDRHFYNSWLIIDELNRANIDKAFGYFFSLFSDQEVELPFHTYEGKIVKVIPLKKFLNEKLTLNQISDIVTTDSPNYEYYFISPNWRIGGTINSSDKASLHQLSHAFIRRFGFVYIPIPDIDTFIAEYSFESGKKEELKKVWKIVNEDFEIGPAIIIDMDNLLESIELDIFDAFEAYILPQIETLPDDTFNSLMERLKKKFGGEQSIGKRFDSYKIKF